jgi:holo-[acyl-carrier protein] synthase
MTQVQRWAVKEAAYKALYPAHVATWKELTYRSLHEGTRPSLVLQSVRLQQQIVDVKLHVSVSHDGDYVFASVVAERPS